MRNSRPKVHVFELGRVLQFEFLHVEWVREVMLLQFILKKREGTASGRQGSGEAELFLLHVDTLSASEHLCCEVHHFVFQFVCWLDS